MTSSTHEVHEPSYKNLDPSKIFTDSVQRRSTYLSCKKFINSQLKNLTLDQKQAAVLEAVRVCLECGLTAEQQHVNNIESVVSYSYDRLCLLLTNLLVDAGESWVEPGPYVHLVKDTFQAADEESNHSSVQREIELLETLKDLRSSMERGSPPPMRPGGQTGRKPKAPTNSAVQKTTEAPKQRRPMTPESDEEAEEDMDWDDESSDRTKMTWTGDEKRMTATLQPRIFLDGRQWHLLFGNEWLEVKRAFSEQYASAISSYPHDTSFIMDVLSSFFRLISEQPVHMALAKGVDRCVARLEYFQRRAIQPKENAKAAELEARILQRELPSHIRSSRKTTDKGKN